jgi:hypothetical protein
MAHQQQADEHTTNSNGVEENVVSVDVLETDDAGTSFVELMGGEGAEEGKDQEGEEKRYDSRNIY